MTNKSVALALRAKILGTLLRDARKTKGASVEACAQAMGISSSEYQLYESGMNAPSMPELEGFAYFLDIPLDHFFSNQVLENSKKPISDIVRLKQVRQRIIGVMLRQTRQEMGISIDQLSDQTGLEAEKLNRIETGQIPVSMPELETICEFSNNPFSNTRINRTYRFVNMRRKTHKQFSNYQKIYRALSTNQ